MRSDLRRALPLTALLFSACLARYAPPSLSSDEPLQVPTPGLTAQVEVMLDDRGIPHAFGQNEIDVSAAIGFMHGRDRSFQVLLLTHAAQGRLTELFGEDLLPVDRRLRIVAWNVDAQLAALTKRDRAILDAYVTGLNLGAKNAGISPEMKLLGMSVPVFSARDCLCILRLQAYQLGMDHLDELVRYRLLQNLTLDDPRRGYLDSAVDPRDTPIVASRDLDLAAPWAATVIPSMSHGDINPALEPLADSVATWAEQFGHPGASNSWAVDGQHTSSGYSVLCNDPHLSHSLPSVFYLAHLHTPTLDVAGATFPGAPMVLIGFSKTVAWGMTASYADAQDLLIPTAETPLSTIEQQYRMGKAPESKRFTETWQISSLGPVLPPGYAGAQEGHPLIFSWAAATPGGPNAQLLSGFFDLAASATADDAGKAVENIRASGMNVTLAFADGSIAYRLAAFLPRRAEGHTGRVPVPAGVEPELVPVAERPQLTSPSRGFIVAANQRVGPHIAGTTGEPPHRARRITERIDELLAKKKPTADELLAIQQDTKSVAARELAPELAKLCPMAELSALCIAISQFTGDFSADSVGALPYTLYLDAITNEVVRSLGVTDEKVVSQVAHSLVIRNAVETALRGQQPNPLVTAQLALTAARHAAAKMPVDVRWGKNHTLQFKGPLASAPLVGGFFTTETFEQSGGGGSVRAEGGMPIDHGAALRMVVELSNPPVGRITIDTGQSGYPREHHAFDQFQAWNDGQPPILPISREAIERVLEARVVLTPL